MERADNRMLAVLPERDLDGLLTVDELAGLLKVPKSWIYEHTRKRGSERLPHLKLGKYLRFFEYEVREFLERKSRNDAH
jgi:excisionase family DNA binding protein